MCLFYPKFCILTFSPSSRPAMCLAALCSGSASSSFQSPHFSGILCGKREFWLEFDVIG